MAVPMAAQRLTNKKRCEFSKDGEVYRPMKFLTLEEEHYILPALKAGSLNSPL